MSFVSCHNVLIHLQPLRVCQEQDLLFFFFLECGCVGIEAQMCAVGNLQENTMGVMGRVAAAYRGGASSSVHAKLRLTAAMKETFK